MNKVLIITCLLTSLFFTQFIFAETYFLENGETAYISGNKVVCGNSNEGRLPNCEESCQHYDSFNDVCNYRIKCDYSTPGFLKKISCDYYDSFKSECKSEKVENFSISSYSCTEKCQHFDKFKQICRYRTKCNYINHFCVEKTICERYGSFDQECKSESKKTYCRNNKN